MGMDAHPFSGGKCESYVGKTTKEIATDVVGRQFLLKPNSSQEA